MTQIHFNAAGELQALLIPLRPNYLRALEKVPQRTNGHQIMQSRLVPTMKLADPVLGISHEKLESICQNGKLDSHTRDSQAPTTTDTTVGIRKWIKDACHPQPTALTAHRVDSGRPARAQQMQEGHRCSYSSLQNENGHYMYAWAWDHSALQNSMFLIRRQLTC